ncbi:hypothetical protein T017_003938 [Salmonella enterica subsp. enterica serovar Pomona]|nr:hypothetical protein [Salmonella enterica subsp. enterica serovar Pomona]
MYKITTVINLWLMKPPCEPELWLIWLLLQRSINDPVNNIKGDRSDGHQLDNKKAHFQTNVSVQREPSGHNLLFLSAFARHSGICYPGLNTRKMSQGKRHNQAYDVLFAMMRDGTFSTLTAS